MKPCIAAVLFAMGASVLVCASAELEAKDTEAFQKVVGTEARLERLATDMQFTEGPVWVPRDGGFLVFSDIPANELKKWSAAGGLTTFRKPSGNANGNTIDGEGRIISCEHSGRRLSRLESNGEWATLVEMYETGRFNSPNDAAVKSDGTIWFTDPDYGLGNAQKEQEGLFVYRFDPKTGAVTVVAKDFDKPNGICFSPDERRLYIADSGKPRHIRVFDVAEGKLTGGQIFCTIDNGAPDGIRCDSEGRLFSSAGDGVQVFATDGRLIGKIVVPEAAANLCFGGADGKTLFITARRSLYSIRLNVKGDGL